MKPIFFGDQHRFPTPSQKADDINCIFSCFLNTLTMGVNRRCSDRLNLTQEFPDQPKWWSRNGKDSIPETREVENARTMSAPLTEVSCATSSHRQYVFRCLEQHRTFDSYLVTGGGVFH